VHATETQSVEFSSIFFNNFVGWSVSVLANVLDGEKAIIAFRSVFVNPAFLLVFKVDRAITVLSGFLVHLHIGCQVYTLQFGRTRTHYSPRVLLLHEVLNLVFEDAMFDALLAGEVLVHILAVQVAPAHRGHAHPDCTGGVRESLVAGVHLLVVAEFDWIHKGVDVLGGFLFLEHSPTGGDVGDFGVLSAWSCEAHFAPLEVLVDDVDHQFPLGFGFHVHVDLDAAQILDHDEVLYPDAQFFLHIPEFILNLRQHVFCYSTGFNQLQSTGFHSEGLIGFSEGHVVLPEDHAYLLIVYFRNSVDI